MKIIYWFLFLVLSFNNAFSQNLSIPETIKYVNDKFKLIKPHFKFEYGYNHEYSLLNFDLLDDGRLYLVEKHRQYKYDNENHSSYDETIYYVSNYFYASDVTLEYNIPDTYPYYLNITCKSTTTQSNCILMSSTSNKSSFDLPSIIFDFSDKNLGASIYNAMTYLNRKLIAENKSINPSINNDPFAPQNFKSK